MGGKQCHMDLISLCVCMCVCVCVCVCARACVHVGNENTPCSGWLVKTTLAPKHQAPHISCQDRKQNYCCINAPLFFRTHIFEDIDKTYSSHNGKHCARLSIKHVNASWIRCKLYVQQSIVFVFHCRCVKSWCIVCASSWCCFIATAPYAFLISVDRHHFIDLSIIWRSMRVNKVLENLWELRWREESQQRPCAWHRRERNCRVGVPICRGSQEHAV